MASIGDLMVIILAALGFILSSYVVYVYVRCKRNSYKPWCEISERISCLKAINSRYGKAMYFQNGIYGLIFYSTVFLAAFLMPAILLYLSIISLFVSASLIYLGVIKQNNYCIVCLCIHIVNITLFLRVIS